MKRFDIINAYIEKYNYKSYLEIGCQWGLNFKEIKLHNKICVDPDIKSSADLKMTSDNFFKYYHKTFDIIFIDGLHIEDQVDRDIQNSLNCLNEGGTIILHDCNPVAEKHQLETWDGSCPWNGTVWRSFVKLKNKRLDLEMFVIDTDFGCAIIREGIGKPYESLFFDIDNLTYDGLQKNRKEYLNLITVEEFYGRIRMG